MSLKMEMAGRFSEEMSKALDKIRHQIPKSAEDLEEKLTEKNYLKLIKVLRYGTRVVYYVSTLLYTLSNQSHTKIG